MRGSLSEVLARLREQERKDKFVLLSNLMLIEEGIDPLYPELLVEDPNTLYMGGLWDINKVMEFLRGE